VEESPAPPPWLYRIEMTQDKKKMRKVLREFQEKCKQMGFNLFAVVSNENEGASIHSASGDADEVRDHIKLHTKWEEKRNL